MKFLYKILNKIIYIKKFYIFKLNLNLIIAYIKLYIN